MPISEAAQFDKFTGPNLLVIDELAVRGETPYEDRVLTHILDSRYDAKRDTILISNQEPQNFTAIIGDSIRDRMHETGGIIECTWDSFRRAT